jgi:hypothetical protein
MDGGRIKRLHLHAAAVGHRRHVARDQRKRQLHQLCNAGFLMGKPLMMRNLRCMSDDT